MNSTQKPLFASAQKSLGQHAPLAERMRPRTLDDIIGQDNIIGPNSSFGKILRSNKSAIPSVLLWGPPGVGKTTIARVIAQTSGYHFVRLSGVLDGVKELREAVSDAEKLFASSGTPTLALVDEIHRFNKAQQDAFLPHVESGLLAVIGQTTENVSFRIRNALLSRMRVLELNPLTTEALQLLTDRALTDSINGLGSLNLTIESDAKQLLAKLSTGDARRVLSGLEWCAIAADASGIKNITKEQVSQCFGSQPHYFDQDADYHYDCISAFIKSMRGSDPDAALYYAIRSLDSGEDPLFITRRMIIFASEDCGCDPRALEIALNVDAAVQRIGMPEGRIAISQGIVYLSCCLKSNASYLALRKMEALVKESPNYEIPLHLRNAPTELMKKRGNSIGYKYPHDFPGGFVPENYLPSELANTTIYQPTNRGLDAQINERLNSYRKLKQNTDKL